MSHELTDKIFREIEQAIVLRRLSGRGIVYFREVPWKCLKADTSIVGTRIEIDNIKKISHPFEWYMIEGKIQELGYEPTPMGEKPIKKIWHYIPSNHAYFYLSDLNNVQWGVDK